jgi:hypothetical protein
MRCSFRFRVKRAYAMLASWLQVKRAGVSWLRSKRAWASWLWADCEKSEHIGCSMKRAEHQRTRANRDRSDAISSEASWLPAKRADCKRIEMEHMLAADVPLKGTNISRVDVEAGRQRAERAYWMLTEASWTPAKPDHSEQSKARASAAKRADYEQNELELAGCKQSELGLADVSNARLLLVSRGYSGDCQRTLPSEMSCVARTWIKDTIFMSPIYFDCDR